MKRFVPLFLPCLLIFAAAPLAAKDSTPQFNTIVVTHFANANGASQSQEFINYFYTSLSAGLQKYKVAGQVLSKGVTVAPADAADSLIIEGKFTSYDKGGMFAVGKLGLDMNVYRASDHALVKNIVTTVPFKSTPLNKDQNVAEYTGQSTAYNMRQELKNISLASIAPAPPGANPPQAGPAAAAPGPAATAAPAPTTSAQISSDPSGAEITIDGDYAGSTPSLIKLKPGTHSIKIAKTGFQPWVRSIEIASGESRTIAAELDPVKQ